MLTGSLQLRKHERAPCVRITTFSPTTRRCTPCVHSFRGGTLGAECGREPWGHPAFCVLGSRVVRLVTFGVVRLITVRLLCVLEALRAMWVLGIAGALRLLDVALTSLDGLLGGLCLRGLAMRFLRCRDPSNRR